ncbi:MAG: hypothetical protein ABI333_29210 [bacterium]
MYRNRTRRIVAVLGFALGLGIVLPAAAGARHRIRFDRVAKVGYRYGLKVQGTFSGTTLITAGGQKVKDEQEKYSYEYEAVVKVLKVDAKGRPIRELHRVVRLTRAEKGGRKTLLKPATLVTAWIVGGKKKFETSQGPVSREARDVLKSAVDFPHSGVTTDDIFGSRRARKIGERWPINAKLALREVSTIFGRKQVPSGASATGHVKLQRRVREAGLPCLQLDSKMTIKGLSPLPPTFTLDKAHVQASNRWVLPLNLRYPPARMSMKLLVVIRAGMPATGQRPPVRIDMRIERTGTARLKPLRKNP